MAKTIILHTQLFPTIGNEICVVVYIVVGKKTHTLVLNHSNADGESEDILKIKITTPSALRSALEKAENEDFALDYNLAKMGQKIRCLPKKFQKAFKEMEAGRASLYSQKIGGCTINYISPRESKKGVVGSLAFVGRSPIPPNTPAKKAK